MAGLRSRLWSAARRPDRLTLLAALLALVLLLPAWWAAARWYGERLLAQERADAALETSLRGNALSSAINRRLARLQGLSAFVQVELSEADLAALFESFSAGLYAGTRGIRSLSVAPGGVVRYVYPLAGNEGLLGTEPASDQRPEVRLDVQRAIESGEVTLTGPLELAQGGQGLEARQAVFQGTRIWGLVSMVLDMPTMLEEAGLAEQAGNLDFALRQPNGQVLFGSGLVFDMHPVSALIQFPDDVWQLSAVPPHGWQAAGQGTLRVFQVFGLIIVVLLAGTTYLSVNRQARLAQAVRQRTQEIASVNIRLQQDITERRRAEAALAEREAQYRSVFESTSDGLLIFDLQGSLVDLNPAAARMHGYTVEEFRALDASQFIEASALPVIRQLIETIRRGDEFRGRARDLRRDGSSFHVEVTGTGFAYRGQPHALAVVRDITEEVEAYGLLEHRVEERTRELSTLLEVSANISSTLELPHLLDVILEQLQQVVDYEEASVLVLEEDELRSVAHRGPRGPAPQEILDRMRLGQEEASELREAMARGEPLIIGDVREETWLAQAFREAFGAKLDGEMSYVRTWVGVPLLVQERLIGWLSLFHGEPHAYEQHHAALALAIANQAATAIQNARLYAQAGRLAALEERQRLARELHDSVSQVLYGIGLGARTAGALLDRAAVAPELKSGLAQPLDYVLSLAEAGLAEMRALIFELRPDSLEREGLVAALVRQADALRARHGLEVEATLGPEPALSFEAKEALYRIAQEALNNTVKHAQARNVQIKLAESKGQIVLELRDDGAGFDPQVEYSGHMGLGSMRERATQIGATLEIVGGPGRGTVVRVGLPAPG